MIDPKCAHIIDTLEWGHRYKKTSSGLTSSNADKTHHSHQGDSIQYLALHYNVQADGAFYNRRTQARKIVPSRYAYV